MVKNSILVKVRHMFSRIPNLHFFSIIFSYFLLKQGRIFLLRLKNTSITIYFHTKRHFAATSNENRYFSQKKIRFGIHEKMSRK